MSSPCRNYKSLLLIVLVKFASGKLSRGKLLIVSLLQTLLLLVFLEFLTIETES